MATLEELQLNGFKAVGNIYVDNSYTEEATPATHPITGEALIFGVNAFTTIAGGTVAAAPEDGSALFVTNTNAAVNFYNGRTNGGGAVYDVYASGVTGLTGMYVIPRQAGQYSPDDSTLNIYIEDTTFASGGYHGFGATTNANFVGDYVLVMKNTSMQYLAVTTGSAYGAGENNAGNQRYAKIDGDITFTLSNVTVSSVAGVARGQVGTADNQAKITGVIENSKFGNIFQVLHMGVEDANNEFNSWADVDITITGTSIANELMILPNRGSASNNDKGLMILHGDVNLKVTGSTSNGLVVGTGRAGTGWVGVGWIDGNVSFSLSGSSTGRTYITKGGIGTGPTAAEQTQRTVTGTISDGSVVGDFIAYELRGDKKDAIHADTTITVTASTIGNFTFLTSINSSGNTSSVADRLYGTQKVELTGAVAGNLVSTDADQADATFTLIAHASETESKAGTIRRWGTLTVEAGAALRATGLEAIESVTLAGEDVLSAGTISEVGTLTVTGEFTGTEVTLISGLTGFDVGSIDTVMVNGKEYQYGVFGGQYSLVGDKLVAHMGNTILVNSNYTDGETTSLDLKGYSTIAKAQAAVADKASTTIVVTTLDTDTYANVFTGDAVTKDYSTLFLGDTDAGLVSLDGYSIIVGDAAAVENADVRVSFANNIKGLTLGSVTGAAKVEIDNATFSYYDGEGDVLGDIDLTTGSAADAQINVSDTLVGNIKLANANVTGKFTLKNSTVNAIYGGEGGITLEGSGNAIGAVYAGGNGAALKLGDSEVVNYVAGLSTASAARDTLVYNDGVSAVNLIVGDATVEVTEEGTVITGIANTIDKIQATITGGNVDNVFIGADGNNITGDVDVEFAGGNIGKVAFGNGIGAGKVDVAFTGGTVAPVNGTFYGLVYGASISNGIDGGIYDGETLVKTVGGNITVDGYAKVGSIRNFSNLLITGGTLNVAAGAPKTPLSSENVLILSGDIDNRRGLQAGSISAKNMVNTGLVGTLRDSAEDAGVALSGSLSNEGFLRTSILTVGGGFYNSGEITTVGSITVDGSFENHGQIYIRSSFSRETSEFSQDGGITLKGVDMVNTGDDAFISTGFLTGVKNLTTSKLYVTGGAEITGNITIEAGAEVAFTNKAVKEGTPAYDKFKDTGLILTGNISMYDTSNLIVSGKTVTGKTLTINAAQDGLIGSNEIVKSEGGLDSWTISWGEGLEAGDYGLAKSDTSIVIYSIDELFVNSAFAGYEDGDEIKINGKTFLFGKNAFATVEDATYFATTMGYTKSSIAIWNDATGMDVDAEGFDVSLYNSTVGSVTAKNIYVGDKSVITTVAASTGIVIDDDAKLIISGTIPDGLPIAIDAADGSGARSVLDVDPAQITLADGQVTVMPPLGNTSYSVDVTDAGKVYLIADANIFYAPGLYTTEGEGEEAKLVPTFADGDIDAATGDALFNGVNVFADKDAAVAAAKAADATLYLVGVSRAESFEGVDTVALEYTGNSSIYGNTVADGETFESTTPISTTVSGSSSSAKLYGIAKSYNVSGDYTFTASNVVLSNAESALYITGNDVNNVMNGNITAELTNVRVQGRQDRPWNNPGRSWNEGIYIGYGSFGTDSEKPIDINVTLRGVTSSNSGFYGIQTQPSDGPHDIDTSTSGIAPEDQVRQDINANINIKVYDSVFGGTFTVLNTNNEHWDANGASILNTYFSSGSITVEVGNTNFGSNNIRLGASLQLGGKAIQEFNVPNTLHIVATENGTATYASYINEWDTLIVDATAQLVIENELQYSTVFGPDQPLDNAGTLTQVMINMSGYKSGTHNVISAGTVIRSDENLSNITVIGDNDLTGQCQLAYAFSSDGSQLRGIYVFDKADDMYVNANYTNEISGTKVKGQELLLNYNAHTSFEAALKYADEWKGSIIVTGGSYESQDFHGLDVEVQNGATIGTFTLANEKKVKSSATVKVGDGAVIGSIDGSKGADFTATLELDGAATIGDVFDFNTVDVKKGVELTLGEVSGAGINLFADNVITATGVTFTGSEKIVIDVTGYTGEGHAVISTANGITGFSSDMVEKVAHDKGKTKTDLSKYDLKVVGNDLVLTTTIQTDTYVNSEYTAEGLAGGLVRPDGTYLEYGFNAFDTVDAAAAALGSAKNTLNVTGGDLVGDVKLGGANFVMEAGTLDGVVYACVNTADKGSFYSGKTYTIEGGTIGGINLTAGEGTYYASNSAIKLGEDVTITGNIIGGGDTVVTSEGKFTVGSIMGVSEIVLNADGFLTASSINLGSGEGESTTKGVIRVKSASFTSEEGNRRLIIDSDTDIQNATYVADPGTALYSTGKQVYVIDLTRVYYDPTYTAEVDGTKAANGDTLLWGVNAFNTLNGAKGALITGGTLYVSHANERIGTDDRLINLVIADSNVPVMVTGMTSGDKSFLGADATLTIENSTIGQDGESWLLNRVTAGNPWDHHNTIGGNLYVTINASTIGGNNNQTTHFIDYLSYTGTEMVFDINDTIIRNDLEFFGDSGPLRDGQTITINMTNVNAPADKWWRITSGNPGNAGDIVVNIKNSTIGSGSTMRFGTQSNWQWGTPAATTNITFSVEDSYFSGYLTAHSIDSGRQCNFTGVKTLIVKGSSNYVRASVHFSQVNIDATSFITGNTMSLDGEGLINVDANGYEGPTKTLIYMNTELSGISEVEAAGLADGYEIVQGSKGVVIADGKAGNLYFDATYTSDVTGVTSAYGDVLIFQDDSETPGVANALTELEAAKGKLTAGNKLFVAANENVLYGTMADEDSVPFVDMVVTSGDFTADGSKIAVADEDAGKTVTGNATIEIAGGAFGQAEVSHEEDDGEGGTNHVVDQDAIYATIDGSKDSVSGESSLVISKAGDMYANISGFAKMSVTADATVHGSVTVSSITIDANSALTVDGALDGLTAIVIDSTDFASSSKVVLSSEALKAYGDVESMVTITDETKAGKFYDGDGNLWAVSEAPGNIYICTSFDDTINGKSFNGDLLFFGVNAFNAISKETVASRSTAEDTVYILDGSFGAADLSGAGARKYEFQGGTFDSLTVDAGSTLTVTGGTSAVKLTAIAGADVTEGEIVVSGYSMVLDSETAATIGAATGIISLTLDAANAANLTVDKIDYLEDGGALTVDFADYTFVGEGNTAVLLKTANGINNFMQYVTPEVAEGEDPAPAYSLTVVNAVNNDAHLMPYYDEASKSVIIAKAGNAGFLGTDYNDSINGTTEVVGGVTNTLVYGYNAGSSLSRIVANMSDGNTLFVDTVNRELMDQSVDLNAQIKDSTISNIQLGVTNDSNNPHTRTGNYTVLIENSTITARSAIFGRGTASDNANTRVSLIAGEYDEETYSYVGSYDVTFKGGRYNDSGSTDNVFCLTQYANIAGDTINVTIEDYTLSCDMHMFDNIWGKDGQQLGKVNVLMKNVTAPAAKWMWIWDPREANSTSINFTIEDTTFVGGDHTLGLFGDNAGDYSGEANVTIKNFSMQGRLSGARGLNTGDVDVAYTSDAKITLHVEGTNDVALVKMFKEIEVNADAMLTGSTISLPDGNTGFVIRATSDYDDGAKEFVVVGTTINNASGARFVDADDQEIAGYAAVVGAKNVFVYKPHTGDVYYSRQYNTDTTGTAVTDLDGTKSFLVLGDNAVTTIGAAYTALEADTRVGAALHVEYAADKDLYAKGYTTVVNGGAVTNLYGGNAPTVDGETIIPADPVDSVDITVNSGAIVTNITVANADSQVNGAALITIGDGAAISGAINGGNEFVVGASSLVFQGAATVGSVAGFDSVTVNANDVVTLTGAFTGTSITIDAKDFADASKKVLTAASFGDVTVNVINGGEGYSYNFVDDGEGKALLVTTKIITDAYANANWTEETAKGFVGDTALVWDSNAFSSAAKAASVVGEGYKLNIQGGDFGEEAVTLEKNNDVIVAKASTLGSIATAGTLTVGETLTAGSISGIASLNMAAGNKAITVTNNIALAEEGTIKIDVTGFTASSDDEVVLTATGGITIGAGETVVALTDADLTVTGTGAGGFHAYYNAEDGTVHLLRLNTLYMDSTFEGGVNIPEVSPYTGEKLVYNVNAFDRMNATGARLVDGMNLYVTHRNGDVHTGGPDMAEGEDGKFLNELNILDTQSAPRVVVGGTAGEKVYVGDTKITVSNSTIATVNDNDSWLVSNVTADQPWSHRNTLFGNVTVDVTNSVIGDATNPGGVLRILNFTYVADRSAEEKSAVNVNFKDTAIYKAVRFLGDSPMGKDVVRNDFSVSELVEDGGVGTTEEFNINLDNVTVGGDVRWAIRGGGSRDTVTGGVVTVNIKDSTFGSQAVFAIEDDWNEGNGVDNDLPKCGTDFVFNVEDATINGYLVAGRRSYDSALAALSVDANGNGYYGARVLNVVGSNYIKNALYFKEVNLTADSSLQGDNLTLFAGNGLSEEGTPIKVDAKINIDVTGYDGPSKVLIATKFTYDDDGNITGGGIQNLDYSNLNIVGLPVVEEGEQAPYELKTDYNAETGTISVVVLKGKIQDVFVNSFYTEEEFTLGTAYKNGDAMFWGENAFCTMVGYEDEETAEWIPGALPALEAEGTVLHVTGGIIETDTLLSNSITVDAGATLVYDGTKAITVDGTVAIETLEKNSGRFIISASGFTADKPSDVLVLSADEIIGDISTDTKAYSVTLVDNTATGGKKEIHLVLKASDVFVNTAWADLEDGTEVTIGETTAFVGYTAFATADAASTKVNNDGTITVIASDVSFSSPIARGVTVIATSDTIGEEVVGSTIRNTTIGSDTTGALTLKAGSVASGINVVGASSLTVEADVLVTGGLGMSTAAKVTFAEGSTLDFNIVGQGALEGARVTNLSSIGESAPNFTVTFDAGMKDGAYALATNATNFTTSVTLQTTTTTFGTLALNDKVLIEDLGAFFSLALNDNNVLTLTKETSQDVIFVNSNWKDGETHTIGDITVVVGENGFANGDAAVAKAISSGATSIKVTGGVVSFTEGVVISTIVLSGAELTGTDVFGTLSMDEGSVLSGKATFNPAEGKNITINGTVAFDTANMTADTAQINGLALASGTATYTLTVSGEVKSGDTYLLATGAEGFASGIALTGTDVTLSVGEIKTIGNLGYKLVLAEGNLSLEISDKPVPSTVYVNSKWSDKQKDDTVTIGDITATIGYDAFVSGDVAIASVKADGAVLVIDGTVSFANEITKSVTINAEATLTGKAAFGTAITIDGTVAFDSANASATAAQFTGFNNVSGETKYTLTAAAVEGIYLLASGVSAFTSGVAFGEYTLKVGEEAVEIDNFTYALGITDNNELALIVEDVTPPPPPPVEVTKAYVNSEWSTLQVGETVQITDEITATIGTDAFATASQALAVVTDDGSVEVVGGEVSFGAATTTKAITVDASATVTGTASFGAAITIDGTVAFDTAFASADAAQFTGFSFVSGDTKYTLTDAKLAVGTYLLADGVTEFASGVAFSNVTLTVGADPVTVGTLNYALTLADSKLALDVTEWIPPQVSATFVNSEWADKQAGETVTIGDITATIGTDAFAIGDQAYLATADDGTITVVAGEVSFTNAINKAVVITDAATLTGKATFGVAITINGTVAFDTAFAADGAQFAGLSYVTGDASYTLTVANPTNGTWTLASDAMAFDSDVVFGDVTLKVGDAAVEVDGYSYELKLMEGVDLILTVSKVVPPAVTKAYVNSAWSDKQAGETVTIGDITATIGTDAFATGDAAITAVADDGSVEVVGGEVSFTAATTKAITIDAEATLTGKATFGVAITINGTVAFDTAFAAANAAQFAGFSYVTGDAKYTLAAQAVAGTYLLASGVSTFTSDVVFGEYTLKVGEEAVKIGNFSYALGITDNSELALVIKDETPGPVVVTKAYVNSDWADKQAGETVTVGDITATIGTDAFATGDAAVAVATVETVQVVDGVVSFSAPITKAITIDAEATLTGKATFGAAITINGTVAFDLALTTATAAQFTGFNYVTGNTKYTLTGQAGAGTYLLATDAAAFNSSVAYGDVTLTVGNAKQIGEQTFTLGITDNTLALTISEIVPENKPDNGWNDYVYNKKQGWNTKLDEFVVNVVEANGEINLDNVGSISLDNMHNMFGNDGANIDTGDAAKIEVLDNAKLGFQINSTADGTFYIYEDGVDKKGNRKQIQVGKVAVKKGKVAVLKDVCLSTTGKYYAVMTAKNVKKAGTEGLYNVTVVDGKFFTDADDGWNNEYTKAEVKDNPQIVERGIESVVLDNNVMESEEYDNFVSFGDSADYAKLELASSAYVSFNLKATGNVKFTLWKYDTTKGKISKITAGSATLKSKNGAIATKTTKAQLLEAGGKYEYYVSMESSDAAKGGSAYYNVDINTVGSRFFDSADDGKNNWLYDKKAKAYNSDDNLVENVVTGNQVILMDAEASQNPDFENFVGYNDAADYAKIVLTSKGTLSFEITALADVTFEIWQKGKDKKGNDVLNSLQKKTTVTVKDYAIGATATTAALSLEAGEYYVSVTAKKTTANEKGSAYYNVNANFSAAVNDAQFDSAVAAAGFASGIESFQDEKSAWQNIASLA